MDVLLKEDIAGTGKKGDIVAVKPGFWRNYLFPQGIATQPTAEYLEELRVAEEQRMADAKASKNAAVKLRWESHLSFPIMKSTWGSRAA